jgi:hypothetical protein
LACGACGLSLDEAQLLAEALQPVLQEQGMHLLVSAPDVWHLRLSEMLPLPPWVPPEQALGADIFDYLPQGPAGRRWRRLLNDIQVVLHQHPLNVSRRQRGLPPVNSLWLWGGGRLPARVTPDWRAAIGSQPLLAALAQQAQRPMQAPSPASLAAALPGTLIDLHDLPVASLADDFGAALRRLLGKYTVALRFITPEANVGYLHRPWHRWRAWRREV